VAVRIAPGVTVGAGVQLQTADGTFRFATGTPLPIGVPLTGLTTKVEGNGWGFGGTAGVMIEATPTTQIGIGYRSQIDQEIDGHISTEGSPIPLSQATEATLHLPDIVTVSIRQVISPVLRLNGTFEWTNWSRFQNLTVIAAETGANVLQPGGIPAGAAIASLPLDWSDGYFLAGGVEYDVYPTLTGRLGLAYEWSPVDAPEKRTPGFPDANRVWLSGGFSWAFTPKTTIDFGYTHIFVEDEDFLRESLGTGTVVAGEVETKVDIVSLGVKTRW
jgi:long-chain fatty acid transport protein